VHFANDTAEISEKIAAKVGLDQRAPALRGEDQMQQNIAGCMGTFFLRPSGAEFSFMVSPTAYAVGCILSPLSRLRRGARY
jgi:hypothetical protein